MIKIVLTVILFLGSTAVATAGDQASDLRLCEAYRGVNSAIQCSEDNYLIQFGHKYCVKYVLLDEQFQPATQIVLAKIRSCLVTELINDQKLNCENSEDRAMQHHLKCYVSKGFCGLPLLEKAKIFGAAYKEARHSKFRATMIAVRNRCSSL